MWKCEKCGRVFERKNQGHSCRVILLEEHFKNKMKARELFNYLVARITKEIGGIKIISLPCCIHLFGQYDFLAALPKKESLEIRISLESKLISSRLKIAVPMSTKIYKNCLEIRSKGEIDGELMKWIGESYSLVRVKQKFRGAF